MSFPYQTMSKPHPAQTPYPYSRPHSYHANSTPNPSPKPQPQPQPQTHLPPIHSYLQVNNSTNNYQNPPARPQQKTYLIVGASRGIGLELCAQLLTQGHRVIATARAATGGSQLWALTGTANGRNLTILECDVCDEASVGRFVGAVGKLGSLKRAGANGMGNGVGGLSGVAGGVAGGIEAVDCCVVNAGVLVYPNRVMEISYKDWHHHLTSNAIGPLMVAQRLLTLSPSLPIRTLVFMSSDSGSAANFRAFEDGFAAYAASKAALNMGLRHLAAELPRLQPLSRTVVLALHPGEVSTDMANATVGWEVEGIITAQESVRGMLRVIEEKGSGGVDEAGGRGRGEATFWTWEGREYPW